MNGLQTSQTVRCLYTQHLKKQIELADAKIAVNKRRLQDLDLDVQIKNKKLRKLDLEIKKLEKEVNYFNPHFCISVKQCIHLVSLSPQLA